MNLMPVVCCFCSKDIINKGNIIAADVSKNRHSNKKYTYVRTLVIIYL